MFWGGAQPHPVTLTQIVLEKRPLNRCSSGIYLEQLCWYGDLNLCNFFGDPVHTCRFIDLWQPRAGLHIHNSYIHTYIHRKKGELGLLKID